MKQLEEKFRKQSVKQEEKFQMQEEKFVKQDEEILRLKEEEQKHKREAEIQRGQIEDLEKKVETIQMIQKQAEFCDSHAGTFFDAIFKNMGKKEPEDIQETDLL